MGKTITIVTVLSSRLNTPGVNERRVVLSETIENKQKNENCSRKQAITEKG